MTNRIGPVDQGTLAKIGNKLEATTSSNKVSSNSPQPEQSAAKPVPTGDTVNLTSDAKLLERLDKTLESLPTVNAERVAQITSAIESGDYVIDSDAIADAMIRLDQALGE